jgi:hypothetical protein
VGSARLTGLGTAQRRAFDERGLVKLDGFLEPAVAVEMADRLWREMARKDGVRRESPSTWHAERPAQFAAFQKAGAFKAMATPELRALLDDLIGEPWPEPRAWGQPLVCFPTETGPWTLPHQVWHLDLTPHPRRRDMMVGRVFALLAPLGAGGGGTLVATGSHRIVEAIAERHGGQLSSQDMRKELAKADPWFADLMSPPKADDHRIVRFMGRATEVCGVALQIEEIVGEPGDVFLMHPHALHGLSSNRLDTPRLALSQTIYPKRWFGG